MTDPPTGRRLLAALSRSVDTVVVVDATGVIVDASPSIASVLGYSREQAIGLHGLEQVHPDDTVLVAGALASTVANPGRRDPLDVRVRHHSGDWLAMCLVGVNCLDDPEVRGIVLTLRDQTGMPEYERAIAERDDRYRQIVEMAAEGVWISDGDFVTTFVTSRMAAMLGYRPDEMIGRPAVDFMDADGRDAARANMDRRRAGISEQTDITLQHRDGHLVYTRLASTPIMSPNGELMGAIGMHTDVTDLVLEWDRLATQEARHRALLDALPDLVFRLDEHGTYLDYHTRRREDLIIAPEEFLGRSMREVIPATAERAIQAIQEAIATGEVGTYELYRTGEDGRRHTFESRVSPMPDRQVIVLVRDVTELRAAEQARRDLVAEVEQRRAEEQVRSGLERQTRLEALGRLAGGVAHDVNNLLGVIGNYAAAIERSTTDPTTVQDVHEIGDAVRRGSALTRRLLMFGRRDTPAPEEHDLVEVVDELVTMLGRGLEPDHTLVADLPLEACPVLVDRDQIGQAVINLVVNAADASPAGSTITIEVRPRTDPIAGDVVELAVSDEGPGMTAEVRDRAFEPFFTTKEDGFGTGLGLSIVHAVAVESGGSVEIDVRPTGGTSVRLRFPATSSGAVVAAPVPSTDPTGPVRVLVVDDDPHALRSTARLLESGGFVVDVATSASEALARIRPPGDAQVVLTDVVMPGTSGPALAARIRAELPELPVVLMTAFGGDLLPPDTGDLVVLSKPLDLDEVRRVLLDAVRARV